MAKLYFVCTYLNKYLPWIKKPKGKKIKKISTDENQAKIELQAVCQVCVAEIWEKSLRRITFMKKFYFVFHLSEQMLTMNKETKKKKNISEVNLLWACFSSYPLIRTNVDNE